MASYCVPWLSAISPFPEYNVSPCLRSPIAITSQITLIAAERTVQFTLQHKTKQLREHDDDDDNNTSSSQPRPRHDIAIAEPRQQPCHPLHDLDLEPERTPHRHSTNTQMRNPLAANSNAFLSWRLWRTKNGFTIPMNLRRRYILLMASVIDISSRTTNYIILALIRNTGIDVALAWWYTVHQRLYSCFKFTHITKDRLFASPSIQGPGVLAAPCLTKPS